MEKNYVKKIVEIVVMCICAILMAACILYGIKIYKAGYGTAFFLIWECIGVFFGAIAIAVKIKLWKKIPKWLKIAIVMVGTLGMTIFIIVEACIASQINAKGEENLDYIIVLGALVKEEGPSSILAARLNSAAKYMEENENTICIVSGGQGANEPFSEAEGMRRYLVEKKGIAEERIIMEPDSMNTIQNIQNSMKLIDNKDAKIGVVTSKFHVYRAVKIAKKQGLTNVCGIAANVVTSYMPNNMFREFFGVVKDTLAGNM